MDLKWTLGAHQRLRQVIRNTVPQKQLVAYVAYSSCAFPTTVVQKTASRGPGYPYFKNERTSSQCKESLLPLLKCLQPQIDSSCIHSAVSLFPPASQPPDPLALEAELQVLSELLPTDVGKARLQQGSWTQWGQQINTSAGKLGSPLDAYSSCITVASNEVLLAYWSL